MCIIDVIQPPQVAYFICEHVSNPFIYHLWFILNKFNKAIKSACTGIITTQGTQHFLFYAQALQTSAAGRKVLVAYIETGTNSCCISTSIINIHTVLQDPSKSKNNRQ